MNTIIRQRLSSVWFIHFLVFLGLFALFGYLEPQGNYLLFFVVLSLSGAICGAFVRLIDAIRHK
jgi:hypothetical protein